MWGIAALLALLLTTPPTPAHAADLPSSLEVVGHDDLGARGLNAALAIADHCAYIGSRGQGPVAIVDVSDPAQPRDAGTLPARGLTTTRELRAVPARKLLVVLSFALARGGANRIDLYRWTDDCARPVAAGAHDFGSRAPHELFLWQDPGGARTLLFVSMFSGGRDDLQVLDVTDPAAPRVAGTWASPVGLLHSISLSPDGRRAYLSMWTGGLLVADASQFTAGQPSPQLTLLTPVASRLPAPAGGNVHSAVQLPGKDLVIVTDERYGAVCPYGPARLVDVSNPAQPRAVSTLSAPENDLATCRASPSGTYTSHNPTIVGDLSLISWYSSGLQVFDVADPARPQRLAELRPQGPAPGLRDPQLGATLAMTWSYPIVRDGLVYVADIDEGLLVLRYHGQHEDQLAQVAFAEGNSNLTTLRPAATPSPTVAPTPAPAATAADRPAQRPAAAGWPVAASIVALAVVAFVAALALATRRMMRS
ncbi:MAG TPA: hypothetical protein VOB72_20270 [Candidatus Dormibacteraeota bacterium]|nr:hypothetical protein [Candidatus Dormibacteraeota bacterium]